MVPELRKAQEEEQRFGGVVGFNATMVVELHPRIQMVRDQGDHAAT
jgi:hypothetical protein